MAAEHGLEVDMEKYEESKKKAVVRNILILSKLTTTMTARMMIEYFRKLRWVEATRLVTLQT